MTQRRQTDEAAGDGARPERERALETAAWRSGILQAGTPDAGVRSVRWAAASGRVWRVARLFAAVLFLAVVVGWPLGNLLAYRDVTGSIAGWSPVDAVNLESYLLATFVPILILLIGYIVSWLLRMMSAAERIAAEARQFIHPDRNAADNARSIGLVVREQMDALNVGLDGALHRLAAVEAMIRQHVEAIETAGASLEARAAGAASRVAGERSRLIELTEQLNRQADAFATAIAEKAQASVAALHSADDFSDQAQARLDERLQKLDAVARAAVGSFNALGEALAAAEESVRSRAGAIDASAAETRAAAERATKAAEAAAETAARNAANVGASAARAASDAKRAADMAIEAARREAERAAESAYEAAEREARRLSESASRVIGDVRQSTEQMLKAVAADAEKARAAAEEMTGAARQSVDAAEKAAASVAKAGGETQKAAEAAAALAAEAAAHAETRNKALADARAALEAENTRLEALIQEQRQRADRLADAIASQTERLSRLAESQLREQEAQARLAEAQLALKKKADKAARKEEQQRAAEAAAEAAKAAEDAKAAEAAEAARRQAEEAAAKAEAERRTSESAEAGILDLGAAARAGSGNGADARARQGEKDSAKSRKGGARREPPLTLDEPASTSQPEARRGKEAVSWREILDATDGAEPLDLAAAAKSDETKDGAASAIKIISRLQSFTFDLETRLYGEPPATLRERFERGDRNVFANRLLRLNESDVKRRIRAESGRDKEFERDIHEFLQGFERLLEDATTSATADEDLEEYLSSPLGRVYLLIGATIGYFA